MTRCRQVSVRLGWTLRGIKQRLRWGLSSEGRGRPGVATLMECGQLVQIFPIVCFSRSPSHGAISVEDSIRFTFPVFTFTQFKFNNNAGTLFLT
jgi:hypothetical protein